MGEQWAIIRDLGLTGQGRKWSLAPGTRRNSREKVEALLDRLRRNWESWAHLGLGNPFYQGAFEDHYRIIRIANGQALRDIDLGPGNYWIEAPKA